MSTYLITGTSRGLGLELTTQLLSRPTSSVRLILATARTLAPALQGLIAQHPDRIHFIPLDQTSSESVEAAARAAEEILGDSGLDVLVNNAGVAPTTVDGIQSMDNLTETLHNNVTGVHLVTASLLPLLRKGTSRTVVNLSTTLASLTNAPLAPATPTPAYKISKTALNMLTVQYALQFGKEGFAFVAVSPGWLRTDLGGPYADLSVQEGCGALLEVVDRACGVEGRGMNGGFYDIEHSARGYYKGGVYPW